MAVRDFLSSMVKLAGALFLAIAALVAAGALVWKVFDYREKRDALPYEEVKSWSIDAKSIIGVKINARTKLVGGTLMAIVTSDGYPQFLSDPYLKAKNRDGWLTIEFLDQDGFKVFEKQIKVQEFTSNVDAQGRPSSIEHEFEEPLSLGTYKSFSKLVIGWHLVTQRKDAETGEIESRPKALDHCAPGLSKAERLKRLAQHGEVRQTGERQYVAGFHTVQFFYDGSLLECH